MDKRELVAILLSDRQEFRRIRDEDPKGTPDLSGVDLAGADLVSAPLAGINFRNASFKGADCSRANFRFADLSGADFQDARLEGATLHQAKLEGANFEGARLGDIDRTTRLCLHSSLFRGVGWSREELEAMLQILNLNRNWEIRYQLEKKG